MESILRERQLTPSQEEELELREIEPRKYGSNFDPDLEFRLNRQATTLKKKSTAYRTYTREEVAELIAASDASVEPSEPMQTLHYPAPDRAWVEQLVREHREYLEHEKKKKQEQETWDSTKTTGCVPRTGNIKRRSTSTKG